MAGLEHLSDAATDLMFAAVDYGVENAAFDTEGFTPFAMLGHRDGKRSLMRFAADGGIPAALAGAREALSSVDDTVTAVTLCWDGYRTDDDVRSEAVFVEAYELGQPAGVLVAQLYERVDDRVEPRGNPRLCDSPAPLVTSVRSRGGWFRRR
jgi:hypothetical protein